MWARTIFTGILPLILIIWLNWNVVYLISKNINQTISQNIKNENHLAKIFIAIALIFFFCHLPRIFLNIQEMWLVGNLDDCSINGKFAIPFWSLILAELSQLSLIVNSSINCLIYCVMSPKFREKVKQKFCCKSQNTGEILETEMVTIEQERMIK